MNPPLLVGIVVWYIFTHTTTSLISATAISIFFTFRAESHKVLSAPYRPQLMSNIAVDR